MSMPEDLLEGTTIKKLHIAISTNKMEESIIDYSARLEINPCSLVFGEYALWRTESLNLSVRYDPACISGNLRHLGWEDESISEFTQDKDINGIIWEQFSAQLQADEINELWPEANYQPD